MQRRPNDIAALLEIAKAAAIEAGQSIMKVYDAGELSVDMKPSGSPVTEADKISHGIIASRLKTTGLPILSEEGSAVKFETRVLWEYFWMVDPLDGTKEFIDRNGEFTVNIALIHHNKPIGGVIHVPYNGILYYGSENGIFKSENGRLNQFFALNERIKFSDVLRKERLTILVSRSHQSPETASFISQFKNAAIVSRGSSLKFMMLLENLADIYPRLGTTMEWDTAAAHAILNASNRGVYQLDLKTELTYNKCDLSNPFFISF